MLKPQTGSLVLVIGLLMVHGLSSPSTAMFPEPPSDDSGGQAALDRAEASDEHVASTSGAAAMYGEGNLDTAYNFARDLRKDVSYNARMEWMLERDVSIGGPSPLETEEPWEDLRPFAECWAGSNSCDEASGPGEQVIAAIAHAGVAVNIDEGVFAQGIELKFLGDSQCRKTKGDKYLGMEKNWYEGSGMWVLVYLNSKFVGKGSRFDGVPDGGPIEVASEDVQASSRSKSICDTQLNGQRALDKFSSKIDEFGYVEMAGPADASVKLGHYVIPFVGQVVELPLPWLTSSDGRFFTPGGSPMTTFVFDGGALVDGRPIQGTTIHGQGETMANVG